LGAPVVGFRLFPRAAQNEDWIQRVLDFKRRPGFAPGPSPALDERSSASKVHVGDHRVSGMKIVRSLVERIGGTLQIACGPDGRGARITVAFGLSGAR